jgi:hypothetical protein
MPRFRCLPIPAETAARFRATGTDDNANTLRRMVADAPGGFPCRHCLCCAEPGETMLLGSYNVARPAGIYGSASPIFLHARDCEGFTAEDVVAPIIRANALVSVRAYDAANQCVYDLGQVCMGAEVDAPLARALGDRRTAFVNVHTARPGCLLARVETIG